MVIAGADRPAVSASQPVVVPLYHTQAAVDVLLEAVRLVGGDLAAKLNFRDEVDYIQQKLPSLFGRGGVIDATEVKTFWAQWLQNGGWWLSQPSLPPTDEKTAFAQKISLVPAAQPPSPDALRLVTYATMLGDGSLANRSWLQETPNPLTTAMWNSWIEIHPDTAARLGIKDDDIVEVTSSAGKVEAIAYLFPALRPDTVAIPFGQGHTALGRWAKDRGCNPANLLEMKLNDAGDLAYGDTWVTLKPTGKTKQLARAENRLGIYGDH
jgi:anaerobic selenocysteine-containing dehydrogenase